MSLKLGTQDIAGISQNKICNAHFLLEPIWSDHIINDISLLRADTFSWQSGDVYVTAYNHLVQDIQGITAETETIGSYTVTFYRATDGHKICLADQETTIANIYSETGIAWYYILDTVNTQFKLPRSTYNAYSKKLPVIGNGMTIGCKNNNQNLGLWVTGNGLVDAATGAYGQNAGSYINIGTLGNDSYTIGLTDDKTKSGIIAQSETLDNMYLYFYVGDYTQTAIEQTAGLNSELFNGKADTNLNNVPASKSILIESYINGTSWYRVYSDGWCEQGGLGVGQNPTVTFIKPYKSGDNAIDIVITPLNTAVDQATRFPVVIYNVTNTGFTAYVVVANLAGCYWRACGYIS